MKIAMLQSTLPPSPRAGGVGYQVDLLASEMTKRGHEVTVFCVEGPEPSSRYRCVQLPISPNRAARIIGIASAFRRLDLDSFTVVHAHGDDWMLGRRARARTFYGSALMEAFTSTSWLRRGAQICYYPLEWLSSANPSAVAISQRTRAYLPLLRTVIPCAFDSDIYFPAGSRTPEPSILFVAGTLAGRKRGHLLLKSFADVRRVLPDATLTIVSRDRVIAPGITCVGPVAWGALADLYRSHWALCSTSSYEGFGVPYIEALATGLPIVSTRNHGSVEVLRNGDLGVICEPSDVAGHLLALLRDPARRALLEGNGVVASHKYSIAVVAEQYERLYRRVAAAGWPE